MTRLGPALSRNPAWSRDGKWIAFDSRPTSTAQIYLVAAGGGSPRAWTSGPHAHLDPVWSEDGKWIYFTSNRTGRYEVFRSPAPKSPVSRVSYEQITTEGGASPRISPDGQVVIFRGRDGACYRMDAREKKVVQLPRGFIVPPLVGQGTQLYGYYADAPVGYVVRYEWLTEKVERLARVDFSRPIGLAQSPDRREILFVQNDRNDSDLMYADFEPFR